MSYNALKDPPMPIVIGKANLRFSNLSLIKPHLG
jgi:hypothetical protein